MRQSKFPTGWDEDRLNAVITHYDQQTEDEALQEDEMMFEDPAQTIMEIPRELVPAVRELLAKHLATHA
jgi:hypothetical protein